MAIRELKLLLLSAFLLIAANQSFAQGIVYERNITGRLIKASSCTIPGFKIDALFEIINRVPFIRERNGYDVREIFFSSTKGKLYEARLAISFPAYYRIDNGPLKLEGAPRELNLYINDPKELMNEQSILFPEETMKLNLPGMFTDTFALTYKNINGEDVGHGINTTYISNRPLYVINPRRTGFFKAITNEQYIKFWIGKLGLDIERDKKQLEESKSNLVLMANNPSLKPAMPELEKQLHAFAKWIDFLKSKKAFLEKRLEQLSATEKQGPAYYSMYVNAATMMDKNGKYVENISGSIPFEPAESADTARKIPILTFVANPWDTKLPKSAFQLIVIADPYREGETEELRELLDKHFYPMLSYDGIAGLMYK